MLESRTLVDAMTQQKPVVKKPVFAKPKKVTIPPPPKKKEQKKKKRKRFWIERAKPDNSKKLAKTKPSKTKPKFGNKTKTAKIPLESITDALRKIPKGSPKLNQLQPNILTQRPDKHQRRTVHF